MDLPLIEIGTSMNVFKAFVCFYGFLLFVWWWYRKREASKIYACFTFVLLGLGIDNAIEAYVRYRWVWCNEDTFRYTIWWPLRLVPSIIPLCGIVWELTVRAFESVTGTKRVDD